MIGKVKVVHVSAVGITANALLLPQCEFLRNQGYDVSFIYSPDSLQREKSNAAGFDVHEQFISRHITPTDINSILKLAKYFRRIKPNIVHTHTSKGGVVGRVAARLAAVPHVIHTIHGFPFIEGQNKIKYYLYLNIERSAARMTDVFLSQSLEDVETAKKFGIKARQGYPVHINNGVDIQKYNKERFVQQRSTIRTEFGIADETVITIVARQVIEKGYFELVKALQRLSDSNWKALFVGPDEGAGELIRKLIQDYELSNRVQILGGRNDIDRVLAASDIFVLPSYREGVPRTVIEAQAMGLPAIVTNIRGCREVVRDGVSGYLVSPGNVESLSSALHKLIDNPKDRIQMGRSARVIVEENFDEFRVFEKIAAIYEKVLHY